MSLNHKPKFFCEFCGTEVKQNDRVCTKCGKFFASVKCPSCGFSGVPKLFKEGCPACGYAVLEDRRGKRHFPEPRNHKAKKNETDPLPWWVYVSSVLFLALLLLFIVLRK